MVDALDLGSSAARRESSSLFPRTILSGRSTLSTRSFVCLRLHRGQSGIAQARSGFDVEVERFLQLFHDDVASRFRCRWQLCQQVAEQSPVLAHLADPGLDQVIEIT